MSDGALRLTTNEGIAFLTLDVPGQPLNTIGRKVKDEFIAVIDRLERDESIRAAVLSSGKPDSFIAGGTLAK